MKRILFLALVLSFSAPAWAEGPAADEPEFLKYHPYSARLAIGTTIGPEMVFLMAAGEFHADQFFSVGPMLQFGLKTDDTYVVPTVGGRFTVPLYFSDRVEFSVQSGIGAMYRNLGGFKFWNFAFEAGANVDVYVIPELTVGIGGLGNVTSSSVQRSMGALFVSATYRF